MWSNYEVITDVMIQCSVCIPRKGFGAWQAIYQYSVSLQLSLRGRLSELFVVATLRGLILRHHAFYEFIKSLSDQKLRLHKSVLCAWQVFIFVMVLWL